MVKLKVKWYFDLFEAFYLPLPLQDKILRSPLNMTFSMHFLHLDQISTIVSSNQSTIFFRPFSLHMRVTLIKPSKKGTMLSLHLCLAHVIYSNYHGGIDNHRAGNDDIWQIVYKTAQRTAREIYILYIELNINSANVKERRIGTSCPRSLVYL